MILEKNIILPVLFLLECNYSFSADTDFQKVVDCNDMFDKILIKQIESLDDRDKIRMSIFEFVSTYASQNMLDNRNPPIVYYEEGKVERMKEIGKMLVANNVKLEFATSYLNTTAK